MSFTFFINNCNNSGGPGIFGARLKSQLEKNGHTFLNPHTTSEIPQKNISIIQGEKIKGSTRNVLRLDGLYFDSENPNNEALNAPIIKSFNEFEHIIYQSFFSKLMYESFLGRAQPNSIIANGINQEEYLKNARPLTNPIFSQYDKICVASASWRRHKRLEEIIEAFRDKRLSRILLIGLGGFDYIKDKSNVPDNVLLTPLFNPNQTSSIYAIADAMIHIAWLDWCPNSVVEALSCGVPVLCSHNGGTKELVKDSGVTIQLEEDYEIGTKIPLYNPPKISYNKLTEGILEVLEKPRGFKRPDLDISNVAKKYEKALK